MRVYFSNEEIRDLLEQYEENGGCIDYADDVDMILCSGKPGHPNAMIFRDMFGDNKVDCRYDYPPEWTEWLNALLQYEETVSDEKWEWLVKASGACSEIATWELDFKEETEKFYGKRDCRLIEKIQGTQELSDAQVGWLIDEYKSKGGECLSLDFNSHILTGDDLPTFVIWDEKITGGGFGFVHMCKRWDAKRDVPVGIQEIIDGWLDGKIHLVSNGTYEWKNGWPVLLPQPIKCRKSIA